MDINLSLDGWIKSIKDNLYDLEEIINKIREDYKGEVFDKLQDKKQIAGRRAMGFMEDINNVFADLKEAKTDEQKIKWVNNIKELFCVEDLQFTKTSRTILSKKQEE